MTVVFTAGITLDFLYLARRKKRELVKILAPTLPNTILSGILLEGLGLQRKANRKEFCNSWVNDRFKYVRIGSLALSMESLGQSVRRGVPFLIPQSKEFPYPYYTPTDSTL